MAHKFKTSMIKVWSLLVQVSTESPRATRSHTWSPHGNLYHPYLTLKKGRKKWFSASNTFNFFPPRYVQCQGFLRDHKGLAHTPCRKKATHMMTAWKTSIVYTLWFIKPNSNKWAQATRTKKWDTRRRVAKGGHTGREQEPKKTHKNYHHKDMYNVEVFYEIIKG